MKVSYSHVKGRASPHCITWLYRKKRYRKYFRSRMDAMRFRNDKLNELGVEDTGTVENAVVFHVLTEIKENLDALDRRVESLESSVRMQEKYLEEMRKPPAPKILRISEAAKVLRVSQRKLYYLMNKGVFKRYKLPHTRTTFIRLDEVEKALGQGDVTDLLN